MPANIGGSITNLPSSLIASLSRVISRASVAVGVERSVGGRDPFALGKDFRPDGDLVLVSLDVSDPATESQLV